MIGLLYLPNNLCNQLNLLSKLIMVKIYFKVYDCRIDKPKITRFPTASSPNHFDFLMIELSHYTCIACNKNWTNALPDKSIHNSYNIEHRD